MSLVELLTSTHPDPRKSLPSCEMAPVIRAVWEGSRDPWGWLANLFDVFDLPSADGPVLAPKLALVMGPEGALFELDPRTMLHHLWLCQQPTVELAVDLVRWLEFGDEDAGHRFHAAVDPGRARSVAYFEPDDLRLVRAWRAAHTMDPDPRVMLSHLYDSTSSCPFGGPEAVARWLMLRTGVTVHVKPCTRSGDAHLGHRAILELAYRVDRSVFERLLVTACTGGLEGSDLERVLVGCAADAEEQVVGEQNTHARRFGRAVVVWTTSLSGGQLFARFHETEREAIVRYEVELRVAEARGGYRSPALDSVRFSGRASTEHQDQGR